MKKIQSLLLLCFICQFLLGACATTAEPIKKIEILYLSDQITALSHRLDKLNKPSQPVLPNPPAADTLKGLNDKIDAFNSRGKQFPGLESYSMPSGFTRMGKNEFLLLSDSIMFYLRETNRIAKIYVLSEQLERLNANIDKLHKGSQRAIPFPPKGITTEDLNNQISYLNARMKDFPGIREFRIKYYDGESDIDHIGKEIKILERLLKEYAVSSQQIGAPQPTVTIDKDFSIAKPSDKILTESGIIKTMRSWAIIIGISKYKNSGQHGFNNLIFADDDAKVFARLLRNLGWSESHIKVLINEEAIERNIRIALESWLTKVGPNDKIVVFWAGHGFPDPEDPEKVYLACYDTDISIPPTGYRMDRVRATLEERMARNVILFADTCHAGKLITRGDKGLSIVPKIRKMQREQNIPKGWIFMVSADTDRTAIEHASWSNGAFTHCLVKALSGEADGYVSVGAKDGIVTMGEVRTYLNSAMPDETLRILGVAKRPVIATNTGDPAIWKLNLQVK